MTGVKSGEFVEVDKIDDSTFVFIVWAITFYLFVTIFNILYEIFSPLIDYFSFIHSALKLISIIITLVVPFPVAFYVGKKWSYNVKEKKYQKLMNEKRSLEQSFEVVLERNPATVKAYVDIFLSTYGNSYPEHLDRFKRLLFLSRKIAPNEVEDAIKSSFLEIVNYDENYEFWHGFKPVYDFKLIHEFAKKYRYNYEKTDLEKLNKLLIQTGIKFHDIKLLETLISDSVFKQEYKNFKRNILAASPSNEKEYIEQFLRVCKDITKYNMYMFYKLFSELRMTELSSEEFHEYMDTKIFGMRLTSDTNRIMINEVDKMNGYEFEKFMGELYEKMGYSVELTPKSGDQGADLIITKYGERTAVQTKNYTENVPNKAIQEVVASKNYYKCTSCSVVTNSYFTKSAIDLGNVNGVKLIDREELKALIAKYM
jgi:HJR/Mrr/RecB family endonuclease